MASGGSTSRRGSRPCPQGDRPCKQRVLGSATVSWPEWTSPCGTVRLIQGDCLEVLPTLEKGSVDAVVTDPPYGIVNQFGAAVGDHGGVRRMNFDWDTPETTDTVIAALEIAVSMCKKSAACFIFCGGDQFGRVLDVPRQAGFVVKPAAWVKKCPPPAGKGNWWPSAFELAVYGYRHSPYFGDTDVKRSNVFVADSYRFGQPGKVDHPTQKPLDLVVRLVSAIVPREGIAIDPFMGSGTTGVACARLGRRFIGIEKEPKYFDIAINRISEALKLPVKRPDGTTQGSLFAGGVQ